MNKLHWDGDNSIFVVEVLMPYLRLSPEVQQVLSWAYGYGSDRSYEMESNGTTIMPDWFMGKLLKEPFSVGHDMIFIWHKEGRADPTGHHWTLREANAWYRKATKEFGFPKIAVSRRIKLFMFSWIPWVFKSLKT